MIDELNAALVVYQNKWKGLVAGRQNIAAFEQLRPTAVCWKCQDLTDYDTRSAALRPLSDHIHQGWIDERWLGTFHLKDQRLARDMETVKLYQRRPGSTDLTGLDHIDFFTPIDFREVLIHEPDLKWSEERNGSHAWLSIWFDNTEAKIRHDSVLQLCADELRECHDRLNLPASNL